MILFASSPVYALGFYPWKRRLLRAFFPETKFRFVRSLQSVPRGAELVVWGTGHDSLIPADQPVIRCEDGFIRSVGLGAKFTPAFSWVADSRGMYFDATRPSDLEWGIAGKTYGAAALARAAALREAVVRQGVSKYNLAGDGWQRPTGAKHVILVPGQVESDASIRQGAPRLRTNLGLLRAVREANPWSHVVYKPHPDVVAGVRREGANEAAAQQWCDEVVVGAAIPALLDAVDEVHVLTSLTGFEALLRGRKVVTYGQPFYAGWGLTEDREPVARRKRKVSLDHLVAAALIDYPLYLHPTTGKRCEAEDFIGAMGKGGLPDRATILERVLRQLSSSPPWRRWIAG